MSMADPPSDASQSNSFRKVVDNVSKGALKSKRSIADFLNNKPLGSKSVL